MNEIYRSLQEFINYIKNNGIYSKNTLLSYQNDLKNFIEFLSENEVSKLNQLSTKLIKKFMLYLGEKNLSPRSINRNLSALRTFFNFLIFNDKIDHNPAEGIPSTKVPRSLVKYLDEKLLSGSLDKLRTKSDIFNDYVILEFLYGTGIRVSELCSLKKSDVDFSNKLIKIFGKGNKTRFIPLVDSLVQLLKEYIKSDRNDSEYLFTNKKGGRLYPKYVERLTQKYLSKISVDGRVYPHLIRHTFATHLLKRGADIRSIKELLGHENLDTTKIYTHVSIDHLKNVYKKSHPKS